MRIWDLPPAELCRAHLLGEHRELHGLWNILTKDLQGYRRHPETRRRDGKLGALDNRHQALVIEMERRGYRHASELDVNLAIGLHTQTEYLDTPEDQRRMLRAKPCECV